MFFCFVLFFCFFAPLGGSDRGSGVSSGPNDIHTHGKMLMGQTEPSPLPKLLGMNFTIHPDQGKSQSNVAKGIGLVITGNSRSIHLQPSPLLSVHSQESLWILEAPESCLEKGCPC